MGWMRVGAETWRAAVEAYRRIGAASVALEAESVRANDRLAALQRAVLAGPGHIDVADRRVRSQLLRRDRRLARRVRRGGRVVR